MPGPIMMKTCKKTDPPHPCDPPPPCDICDDGDECPKPSLCVEKILNPQEPYETRCKPGAFLPASICKPQDPPHPCDPPPPCKPGKQKKIPCPRPSLCKERVLNPESPLVICPHPEDEYSEELCDNLELLRKEIRECAKEPCAKPVLLDPFEIEIEEGPPPIVPDPNEYLYSRELCKHLDMLKQKIISCFSGPCPQPELKDPFEEIDEESKYPDKQDPCNIDPRDKKREDRKRLKQWRKEKDEREKAEEEEKAKKDDPGKK